MQGDTYHLIINMILDRFPTLVLLLSIFFEITPIKFSPLTLAVKWIGKILNKETHERLGLIEEAQEAQADTIERLKEYTEARFDAQERAGLEQQAVDMRNEIINFSENLKLGRTYSDKQFEYILGVISDYHEHCARHQICNHYIDEAHEFIRESARKQFQINTRESED
nr:MAG TPA: hypothetical protein [Caudoviricetes sp.]